MAMRQKIQLPVCKILLLGASTLKCCTHTLTHTPPSPTHTHTTPTHNHPLTHTHTPPSPHIHTPTHPHTHTEGWGGGGGEARRGCMTQSKLEFSHDLLLMFLHFKSYTHWFISILFKSINNINILTHHLHNPFSSTQPTLLFSKGQVKLSTNYL